MDELYLEVVGKKMRVRSEETRWLELLAIMFEPHMSEIHDAPSDFVIEGKGDWTFGFSDGEQARTDDPWYLIFRTRVLLAEKALLEAPLVTLHAGMASKDGEVIVFVGGSGSGKSTLGTDLSEMGWAFGSDEFVAFNSDGMAIPLTLPAVHEGTDGWRRWSQRWEVPRWLPSPKFGFAIPPSALHPLAAPMRPTRLVFISFDPEAGAVRTDLTAADGLARAGGHSFVMDPVRMRYLADVFRATPSSALVYPSSASALETLRGAPGI